MKLDKQLLEAWENAVALGHAWLEFVYAKNKRSYYALRRDDNHSGLQSHMERELIWRLSDGEFQAFGVEHGGDAGPILIPKYYFSKNPEVDWDRETVEAFGKKFHVVRVQGKREQELADQARSSEPPPIIDLREIATQRARERLLGITPSEPETSNEPIAIADQGEGKALTTLPRELSSSTKPRMGRPPLLPHIREVVSELINWK